MFISEIEFSKGSTCTVRLAFIRIMRKLLSSGTLELMGALVGLFSAWCVDFGHAAPPLMLIALASLKPCASS